MIKNLLKINTKSAKASLTFDHYQEKKMIIDKLFGSERWYELRRGIRIIMMNKIPNSRKMVRMFFRN